MTRRPLVPKGPLFALAACALCVALAAPARAARNDDDPSPASPVERARDHLALLFKAGFDLPAQSASVDRVRQELSAIGTGRAIVASSTPVALRIPVYLRDSTARFLTVDLSGRVLETLDLPLPPANVYLIPLEWKRMKGIPIQVPTAWVDPVAPRIAAPPFPVCESTRAGLTELAGLPVDPARLQGFYLLPDALALPAKNIEESPAFIADLRDLSGNRLAKYCGSPRTAPFLSMAAAAAGIADWWRVASTGSDEVRLVRHQSRLAGRFEYGVDPWDVQSRHAALAAAAPAAYPVWPGLCDPVLGVAPPAALEPYARLLARQAPLAAPDWLMRGAPAETRETLLPGCLDAVRLFADHAGSLPELEATLRRHGPLLAASDPRVEGVSARFPLFGFPIVGCGNSGGVPCVLYRDCHGDGAADRPDDADGGPQFRLLPLAYVREAWYFPHEIELAAEFDWAATALVVTVRAKGGGPVDPTELSAEFVNEKSVLAFARRAPGVFVADVPKGVLAFDRPEFRIRTRKAFFGKPGPGGDAPIEIRYMVK